MGSGKETLSGVTSMQFCVRTQQQSCESPLNYANYLVSRAHVEGHYLGKHIDNRWVPMTASLAAVVSMAFGVPLERQGRRSLG